MNTLDKNWFFQDLIDLEYKKYILLAYLKEVHEQFNRNKLYPHLSELVEHYNTMKEFLDNKQSLYSNFPERIKDFDSRRMQILYEKVMEDDKLMQEIGNILQYSLPQVKYQLNEGKEIYEFVEEQINISPIGIVPLYKDEGYFLLKGVQEKETRVFEYQCSIFENAVDRYRGIHISYLTTYTQSITNTFESMKKQLMKEFKKLPNPATFLVESDIEIPVKETLIPIASRMLVRYISTQS